jgi:hypothetical protein
MKRTAHDRLCQVETRAMAKRRQMDAPTPSPVDSDQEDGSFDFDEEDSQDENQSKKLTITTDLTPRFENMPSRTNSIPMPEFDDLDMEVTEKNESDLFYYIFGLFCDKNEIEMDEDLRRKVCNVRNILKIWTGMVQNNMRRLNMYETAKQNETHVFQHESIEFIDPDDFCECCEIDNRISTYLVSLNHQTYNMGKFCTWKLATYHSLVHFDYHVAAILSNVVKKHFSHLINLKLDDIENIVELVVSQFPRQFDYFEDNVTRINSGNYYWENLDLNHDIHCVLATQTVFDNIH